MPHSIPAVVAYCPWPVVPSLSNIRQTIRTAVQMPAAVITPPSPPGTWKALPSARTNRSTSTPSATSSTAASTNENAPQPVSDALADRSAGVVPLAITVS